MAVKKKIIKVNSCLPRSLCVHSVDRRVSVLQSPLGGLGKTSGFS
uniref:Meprin A metalloprotease n=1 Tax=Cyriopagopus schmidti TaxID=29017 RepID=B5M6E1_CYRSC|nr:meprin A metalloprotease [Cyriopagopus schmidti]